MAGIDLTRFDFHAMRFMESEDVSAMSADEIGQYLLLLIKSWLGAKDASLPDDLEFLARTARVNKVSDRVLKKFPVAETKWGMRRQNPTLYGEWMVANSRSQMASETGRIGNEKRWGGNREPIGTLSQPESLFVAQAKPNQSEPTQTNPSQEHGSGTFKFIAVRYSSFFGINHSHSKKHIEKYQNACARHGEDLVLNIFDRWAGSAGWLKERRDSNGLNFFWKPMEEIIEGDQLRLDREESARKPDADLENKIAAQIESEKLLDAQDEKTKAENRRLQKEFEAANANEI